MKGRESMLIRKSSLSDLPRMEEIYEYARGFMAAHGNPHQWGHNHWPPRELLVGDIEAGKSYVCLNAADRVIGTFFMDFGPEAEPGYADIRGDERRGLPGCWASQEPYGVVHRIAGDGSEKGIGTFCLNWAFEQCGHLRIDTHPDNLVMQGLLDKLGFSRRGVIFVPQDSDPRIAFEKQSPLFKKREPGTNNPNGGTFMKTVSSSNAPAAVGPYSQAQIANGLVFCSGQLGLDPVSGVLREGLEAQCEQAFMNLQAVLEAAGSGLGKCVKTTVFLVDMNDFAVVNGIYAKYFRDPFPARSCVQVAALPKGALVECEAIAEL